MPTYEYRCQACSHYFEAVQSMRDDPLTDCPQCAGKVQRLISKNVGIAFKGSGFYVTDSAKSNSPDKKPSSPENTGSGSDSTPASPQPATPAAAKSESAPASATSETKSSSTDTP